MDDAPTPQRAASAEERERLRVTPFYKRSLDSFSDSIITEVHQSEESGLWYAVLDRGADVHISTDFSSCADTAEKAVSICASKMREDQRGVGKFAPHDCMREGGYDFHWKLCKWWAQKEALIARVYAPLLDRITAAEARAEEAERERDEVRADRSALTKALTGLTCNGSEFFTRRRGEFVADIDACVHYVRDRFTRAHDARVEALRAEKAATADRDRLADEVAQLRSALTPIAAWSVALDDLFADHEDDVIAGGVSLAVVTFGDLRAARRALTVTGGTTDGQA